jgi:hypothetical protein
LLVVAGVASQQHSLSGAQPRRDLMAKITKAHFVDFSPGH